MTEDTLLEQSQAWCPGGLEVEVRVQPGGAQLLKVWNLVDAQSWVEYGVSVGCHLLSS